VSTLKTHAIAFVMGAAIAAALVAWLGRGSTTPGGDVLQGQATVAVACTQVQTYPERAARKLAHAPAIAKRPDVHLVAATRINADGHDHTVSALYHSANGKIDLYDYQHALPLLQFRVRGSVSVAYGATDAGAGWMAGGTYSPVQTKQLQLGLQGMITSRGNWFAGAGVSVPF